MTPKSITLQDIADEAGAPCISIPEVMNLVTDLCAIDMYTIYAPFLRRLLVKILELMMVITCVF